MRGLVNYEDSDPESGDEVSVSTLNVAPDVPIEVEFIDISTYDD